MKHLILVLATVSCTNATPTVPPKPHKDFVEASPYSEIKKVYDLETGVICYWISIESLSCVKIRKD